MRLSYDIERALADFIEREVSMHVKLEVIKQSMIHCFDYTNLNAFNCIDCTNEGVLTHRNIAQFLRLNGHNAADSELIAIVRRIDADAD